MTRLRAHVDGHPLNAIPGPVPRSWMEEHRLQPCARCGKTVAATAAHAMHTRCWARVTAERDNIGASAPDTQAAPNVELLSELPSIHEVCTKEVSAKEFVEADVLALAEPEFLRCVANAALHRKGRLGFCRHG